MILSHITRDGHQLQTKVGTYREALHAVATAYGTAEANVITYGGSFTAFQVGHRRIGSVR
jgi:hypothetical protein